MSTYGSSTRRKPSVGRSGMRCTSMPRAGRSSRWTNRCVFSLTPEKYTSDPTGTHLRPALLRLLPYVVGAPHGAPGGRSGDDRRDLLREGVDLVGTEPGPVVVTGDDHGRLQVAE